MSATILGRNFLANISKRLLSTKLQHPIEPEPGLCCQEGCASCVWLVYGNELLDYYRLKYPGSNKDRVRAEIEEKIESPSVKTYVLMEIEMAEKRMENLAAVRRKNNKKKKT